MVLAVALAIATIALGSGAAQPRLRVIVSSDPVTESQRSMLAGSLDDQEIRRQGFVLVRAADKDFVVDQETWHASALADRTALLKAISESNGAGGIEVGALPAPLRDHVLGRIGGSLRMISGGAPTPSAAHLDLSMSFDMRVDVDGGVKDLTFQLDCRSNGAPSEAPVATQPGWSRTAPRPKRSLVLELSQDVGDRAYWGTLRDAYNLIEKHRRTEEEQAEALQDEVERKLFGESGKSLAKCVGQPVGSLGEALRKQIQLRCRGAIDPDRLAQSRISAASGTLTFSFRAGNNVIRFTPAALFE